MRIPIALAIYVSLTAAAFADKPVSDNEIAPEWRKVYDSGLAASRRNSYDEAIAIYQTSWDTAQNAGERGAVAIDLGQTYRHLGRAKEATIWFDRARHEWSAVPNQEFMLAASAVNLADLERSTSNYNDAERVLRETLDSLHCSGGKCDETPKTLVRNALADLLREEGRSGEAENLFDEAIKNPLTLPRDRISALIGLADIDRQKGMWESSIARWHEVLEIARREKDTKAEGISLRGLAMTWLGSGSAARAEPLLRRSLRVMESDPETPPEQIASTLSGLGELYRSENKLTLAEEQWSRALQIDRKALGETHPQVAWLMEVLADVYSARGEFTLAADYATRASEMMSGSFGAESMPVAAALTNRALVEERARDLEAAAKDYEHALNIARKQSSGQPIHAAMARRYASLLKSMHRDREAKALGLEARTFQYK